MISPSTLTGMELLTGRVAMSTTSRSLQQRRASSSSSVSKKKRTAAPDSYPRTKLPFLQLVVQQARKMEPLPTPPLLSPSLLVPSTSPMKKKSRDEEAGPEKIAQDPQWTSLHSQFYMKASAFAPYPSRVSPADSTTPGGTPAKGSGTPSSLLSSRENESRKEKGVEKTSSKPTSFVLYRDEVCILVNDAYPKSTVHGLILPLDPSLLSLNELLGPNAPDASISSSLASSAAAGERAQPGFIPISYDGAIANADSTKTTTPVASQWISRPQNHVQLLEHMCSVGDAYVQFLQRTEPEKYANRRFITGFHALPSLAPLHMHLVSMDLESPCLKNKKHYNSFSTYFFLTSDRILDDLRTNHRITINQDTKTLAKYESQPMECLWCGMRLKDMPMMKQHVPRCPLNKAYITSSSP